MDYSIDVDDFTMWCTELAKHNDSILNLNSYSKDRTFKFNGFENYIEQINKNEASKFLTESLTTLLKAYKNNEYIGMGKIIDILDKNIEELLSSYNDYVHILIFGNNSTSEKSNLFLTLYFIKEYNKKSIKQIKHIFQTVHNVFNYNLDSIDIHEDIKNKYDPSKKYLIIICDDFTYSGTQIYQSLNDNINNLKSYKDNINIYINIFGYTKYAKERLLTIGKKENGDLIHFPSNAYSNNDNNYNIIGSLNNITFSYEELLVISGNGSFTDDNDEVKIKKLQEKINKFKNFLKKNTIYKVIYENGIITNVIKGDFYNYYTNLIDKGKEKHISHVYLDFKYPDYLSTVGNLCNFEILTDGYYIDTNLITEQILTDVINRKYESINALVLLQPDIIKQYIHNIDESSCGVVNIDIIDKSADGKEIVTTKKIIPFTDIDLINTKFDSDNYKILCNNKLIEPFYKKSTFKYKNLDNVEIETYYEIYTVYQMYKNKLLKDKVDTLNKQCTKLENKYYKYKTKYMYNK